jgi:ABC-type polysaccharide/polyol phosphate transport system ATPase subunit
MPIIEVNHLSKEYKLGNISTFKVNVLNALRQLFGRSIQTRAHFKALDDVSFTIEQGEVVGIIGHNGAGKSTLLKHLANISNPTKGQVIVRGSIAPLIEVGAGINPELTGRENIFLNGAILGIPKRIIQQKLDDIISFSELEQFIDTPVKRYSSGMTVKLGFSIATSMDADILIIDEVLAVGDLAFQRKCFDRMEDLIKRQGKTVLIVSHNIRQIERLCTRVIMFNNGKVDMDGVPKTVCNAFYAKNNEKIHDTKFLSNTHSYESCDKFKIESVDIIDNNGISIVSITSRSELNVRVRFTLYKAFKKPEIIIGTHTTDFVYLTASSTVTFDDRPDFEEGTHEVIYSVESFPLIEGSYAIRFSMFDENRGQIFSGESLKVFTVKETGGVRSENGWLTLNLPTTWTLKNKKYFATVFSYA